MINEVKVRLKDKSYDIKISDDLLPNIEKFLAPLLVRPRVVVITDKTVEKHHLGTVVESLTKSGVDVSTFSISPGELSKNWATLEIILDWLLKQKIERNDLIVALGGGVIGDLVGFSASILKRGVRYVQVPTSLLAQVDSSVGGKTGINAKSGKNLIGSFYHPELVLADVGALETLNQREILAGYGEVVKYGLLGDATFFEWLEQNAFALINGNLSVRIKAVQKCCEMKAEIVSRDERENGDRALLNLGHTFCHALESATGYSDRLLHGEGVAMGCVLAFELSSRLGMCSQEDPSRVRAHLKSLGIKTDISEIDGDLPSTKQLIALMAQDKKVINGKLRFILANGIGHAVITEDVPQDVLSDVINGSLSGR
ncbi:MAG: 3-dehydroquinate synthase [Proteobacteria bacterium]|jgi:3-dehydroquinate synthase|nr:3-dehydroquinate synthase [Pseudomonadota bacterium]